MLLVLNNCKVEWLFWLDMLQDPIIQVAQLSQRDRATHELLRFAKLRSGIFEPPFGRLREKVGALSIRRWKARDWRPICYSWRTTSRNISNSTLRQGVHQFDATFDVEGLVFPQHLCTVRWGNECTTALPLEVFSQKNFVADLVQLKLTFIPKTEKFAFWATLWET